jgi:hypothetical protein
MKCGSTPSNPYYLSPIWIGGSTAVYCFGEGGNSCRSFFDKEVPHWNVAILLKRVDVAEVPHWKMLSPRPNLKNSSTMFLSCFAFPGAYGKVAVSAAKEHSGSIAIRSSGVAQNSLVFLNYSCFSFTKDYYLQISFKL